MRLALASLNTGETSNRGRSVELVHIATQVPIGIRFYVLGCDSNEFKRIQRKQQAENLEKQKRTRRGLYLASPEETELLALELLSNLTTGWDQDDTDCDGNIISVSSDIQLEVGEFIPFSKEAARRIYSNPGYSWIREQIDAAIGDRKDFLPQ